MKNKILIVTLALFCIVSVGIFSSCGGEQASEGLYYDPHFIWDYDIFGEYVNTGEIDYYTVSLGGCVDSDIIIPDTHAGEPVLYLDSNSFKNNERVTSFTYNKYIEEINGELNNCKNLTRVTLGKSIENINVTAFIGCDKLTNLEVSSQNASFTSVDGILYSKDKSMIVRFPQGKNAVHIDIPESIKMIGDGAFIYCKTLEEVILPSTLKGIGEGAFSECEKLSSISLPSEINYISSYAFTSSGLTSISIPDSINQLGESVFADCKALKEVKLPNNITQIGMNMFYGCESLEEIKIPNTVEEICDFAFKDCSKLKAFDCSNVNLSKIGINAFEGCVALTEIKLPNAMTRIGEYTFKGCEKLEKVTIFASFEGEGIERDCLGKGIFDGCSAIKEANISCKIASHLPKECLTKLTINSGSEVNGFTDCKALKTVIILDAVGKIGDLAFSDCSSLDEVTFGKVSSIGGRAFLNCISLKSIVIPSSVSKISSAFKGCTNLEKVTIENGVQELGGSIFLGCTSLKEITIPSSVKSLGSYAFENCTALKSVTLSNSLTKIEEYTFYGCTSIYELVIPEGVTSIAQNAIRECTSLVRLILPSTLSTYVYISDAYKLTEIYNPAQASISLFNEGSWTGSNRDIWPMVKHTDKNATSIIDIVDDFVFATINDEYYLVCYIGDSTEIVLPSSYKDSTYTIRSGAFIENEKITKITITNGVSKIDPRSFCLAKVTDIIFENTENWKYYDDYGDDYSREKQYALDVSDSKKNATDFSNQYNSYNNAVRYIIKDNG